MSWSGNDPSKWAANAKAMLTTLVQNSVEALEKEASATIPNGGRVPVKFGYLARSFVVSLTPPSVAGEGSGNVASTPIADIKPGDVVYLGWTAIYAKRANYGFVGTDSLGRTFNQQGYGFAEAAAAQWPAIVLREAQKIASRRKA